MDLLKRKICISLSSSFKYDGFCVVFPSFWTYFVSEGVLLQVVRLDELHPTFAADVRSDVLVFHHVVLKLTRVLESFLALCAPAGTEDGFIQPRRKDEEMHTLLSSYVILAFDFYSSVRISPGPIREQKTKSWTMTSIFCPVLKMYSACMSKFPPISL